MVLSLLEENRPFLVVGREGAVEPNDFENASLLLL